MRTFVLLWLVAACIVVAFNASAHAQRSARTRYHAVVLCDGIAEDSAAHVTLVRYGHDDDGTLRIVYRCDRYGY